MPAAVLTGLAAAVLFPLPASAAPGDTTRASLDSAGTEGNDDSAHPSVSANGRYVAFHSFADNLVVGDTNTTCIGTPSCRDVFVRDRQTGATERISLPNLADQGTLGTEGDNASLAPSISADGRYVAFSSLATNLVLNDTNSRSDVFVHDRDTGITTRVSVDSFGAEAADGVSGGPAISGNGRYVAFNSLATNLVLNDNNALKDVFVHDRDTGTTIRVSVDSFGAEAIGGDSENPANNFNGQFVSFDSAATNLVLNDNNALKDVFVHDRGTGTTTRVSVPNLADQGALGTEGDGSSELPDVSDNGRYVAFQSAAANLVLGDTLILDDVFVHDSNTGITIRVSVDSAGNQAIGGDSDGFGLGISGLGNLVAFASRATNLVPSDTNGDRDVFVHDWLSGTTTRVSVDSAGTEATDNDGLGIRPAISGLGGLVAFDFGATNLVPSDTNGDRDVFAHELLLCGGLLPNILGTPGDDAALTGTAGPDVIHGLGGDDTISGLGGIDFICGGDDQDTLNGDEGNDALFGGDGVDILNGGIGNDLLFGGDNMDSLFGDDGKDALFGGAGTDDLHGGIGKDLLVGNAGDDNLNGDEGNDSLFGNADIDRLNGGEGNDKLFGGPGGDDLFGDAGNDRLFGNAGSDDLFGGEGRDRLFGGEGTDDLFGEAGNDRLFGGLSDDDLDGGLGVDRCSGGLGINDTAVDCETVILVP